MPEPKSKRTPVRLRHKIEKASAAKQRKQRKASKKVVDSLCDSSRAVLLTRRLQHPEWTSRLKKDPGIPNLFPYKDRILNEIEEKRRLKDEEAARKRSEERARRRGLSGTGIAPEEETQGLEGDMAEQMEDVDVDLADDDMDHVSFAPTWMA